MTFKACREEITGAANISQAIVSENRSNICIERFEITGRLSFPQAGLLAHRSIIKQWLCNFEQNESGGNKRPPDAAQSCEVGLAGWKDVHEKKSANKTSS